MHRFAISLIAAASALTVSTVARADLVCSDALASATAQYRWDELPPASSALFLSLEACACGSPEYGDGPPVATPGPCSDACSFTDAYSDWGCGLTWRVSGPLDEYVWTQTQADACGTCIAAQCGALSLACWIDGS